MGSVRPHISRTSDISTDETSASGDETFVSTDETCAGEPDRAHLWSRMMKYLRAATVVAAVVMAIATSANTWAQSGPTSQWVFPGDAGGLHYQALPNGETIMDFSPAGYMGGGVALPSVPVLQTVSPSGGDDTGAIQAAINAVSALAPDSNGFRGAVLLTAG